MKHFFICVGLLAMLGLCAAQSSYSQVRLRLGFDGGFNIANESYSRDVLAQPQVSRLSFVLGGIAEVAISDLWSVQAELRYVQKGTKFTGFSIIGDDVPEVLGTADLVYNLAYVEMPILIKVKFGTADIRPILFAGPNIGLVVSANHVWDGFNVEQATGLSNSVDVKDKYKSVDVCLDIGGGAEYYIGSVISLIASARYSLGLTDLNNDSDLHNITIKSSGIQILIGLLATF